MRNIDYINRIAIVKHTSALLKKLRLIPLCFVAMLGVKNSFAASYTTTDTAKTFNNVLRDGADPWVIKDKGYYYFCLQQRGGVAISKSKKLSAPGEFKQVWHLPKTGWNKACLWAPELHHIGKKWYIYYAAGESGPPFIHQRSGVLESVTDDPQGKYIDKGMLKTGNAPTDSTGTFWAIDLTVDQVNGQLYAVWSGWGHNPDTDKTPQNLYIAKMNNPWTISSDRVKLSAAEEPWETGGPLNLNEGPEFLKHNGNIFIIYSTRESWTPAYRLGQLRLIDSTKNPMDAKNWIKTGPVFKGTPEVYGVGHASFTTSPDDKQWWILYHSKKETKGGWPRNIRLQEFTWNKDGSPNFGKPLPPGTMLKKPSGE